MEDVYEIDSSKVLHIHEDIDSQDLVVGYKGEHYQSREDFSNITNNINIKDKINILDKMRRFIKDTQYHIERNHLFFENLSDVNSIVIIGHSCADVDKPYFERMSDEIMEDASWQSFYHEQNDLNRYETFLDSIMKKDMTKELIIR